MPKLEQNYLKELALYLFNIHLLIYNFQDYLQSQDVTRGLQGL